MKRLWIVLVILVGIIWVSTSSLLHLIRATEQMTTTLDALSDAIGSGDEKTLYELSEKFCDQWEEHEAVMLRYIHHDELDAITGSAVRLPALVKYNDTAQLAAEIDRLRHLLRHVRDAEFPTIKNIL